MTQKELDQQRAYERHLDFATAFPQVVDKDMTPERWAARMAFDDCCDAEDLLHVEDEIEKILRRQFALKIIR